MATSLADPPAAPSTEQPTAPAPADGPLTPAAPTTAQRSCANCGSPMDSSQDWCLQCGAGTPDSLAAGAPSWRSAATILGAVVILVAGAVTAAYAALNESSSKARPVTVAQTLTPATATPATPTAPSAVAPTTPKIGTPTTVKPLLPSGRAKPPKIPLTVATPKPSVTTTPSTPSGARTTTPSTTTPKTTTTGSSPTTTAPPSKAILLDTNAAATYNPYSYPASSFGDPSLAVDGDTSTAWTAQVDPAKAPRMAEGLVIDLKTGQKLSALELITSSPGMTVQVWGANGALPASITDPAWVQLSPSQVVKTKHLQIKLRHSTTAYHFVTLWISMAPAASIGTAKAPGHVSVNEIELFPATK